tara:strand:- start:211 stop:1128 length:918 start_codon:yes stop_codon:yes gene_type:complete
MNKTPLYSIEGEKELDGIFRLYRFKDQNTTNTPLPHVPFPTNHPHRHNFFEICIFIEGSGNHILDFENYEISSHSIHVISPGRTHLMNIENYCNGYILAFNREFQAFYFRQTPNILNSTFFLHRDIPPILSPGECQFEELIGVLTKIKEELAKDTKDVHLIIRSYLNIFLLKLEELFVDKIFVKGSPVVNELFVEFRDLVEENYGRVSQVKEYACMLHITPIKLNRICVKFSGKNAGDYILDRIMLEAKRQLIFTSMSNKEIAFTLNYDDPSYFSRLFRKKTGMSPSEFRKETLSKWGRKKVLDI